MNPEIFVFWNRFKTGLAHALTSVGDAKLTQYNAR